MSKRTRMLFVVGCLVCLMASSVTLGVLDPHHHMPLPVDTSGELANRLQVAAYQGASNANVAKSNAQMPISFSLESYRANANHAAGNDGSWLSEPKPFVEYGYGHNRAKERDGLTTNTHTFTGGVCCKTFADFQTGAIFSLIHANGNSAGRNGVDYDEDGFTATFFISKNIQWLYFGTSLTYGYSGGIARTKPAANRFRTKIDSNTLVVCPYIGAIYVNGPFSASITPTYVYRYQNVAYRSGINNSTSEGISDGTFVLANKASYAVNEKFWVDFNFDYNQIIHEDDSKFAQGSTDRGWLTLGPKFTYCLTESTQISLSYTATVANEDFENHQITVGLDFRF
ncbi:MAG: hypothetical protein KAV00_08250 [Phycisphaerae bacterium]|nr:hypothetical protein [Phycisphaerae bacterium]